jgi:hypothetical protein
MINNLRALYNAYEIKDRESTNTVTCILFVKTVKTFPLSQTGDALVRIYPNPCNGKIRCELKNIDEENLEITLTDLTERELIKEIFAFDSYNNKLEIPISKISNGNYIFTLTSNKKIYLNALLIKR